MKKIPDAMLRSPVGIICLLNLHVLGLLITLIIAHDALIREKQRTSTATSERGKGERPKGFVKRATCSLNSCPIPIALGVIFLVNTGWHELEAGIGPFRYTVVQL